MTKTNEKIHVLVDEKLGDIKREYLEIDREAKVGEKIILRDDDEIGTFLRSDSSFVYLDLCGYRNGVACDPACCRVLEPTNIVHNDGQRYEMVDRKAKVGEKIISITKCDIYSKGEIGTVGYQSPPHYIYVRFETRASARSVSHEDYLVLLPLDKHEKIHKNKNSGYKEMKNLIHNELGITRQDIQEMINVAVSNEVQKMSESGKLDSIAGVKIESLIEEGFRDGGRLLYGFKEGVSESVSEEVGKRIANVLNINVKLKEERN
ncbi:hypothetical protein BLL41_10975 [Bacillus sp. FMQ74]|uniref:hypothetical protein n=1 Tax=Bacillus sp. FMQ74 TaxID=1913579 RepID=UPI0008FB0B2D|nr:hypothetical protein [Bacillus sp. FMQ74]OIR60986.1 hypothetical protein BLL41_10975 [Bacillus sp. FMQ74]